MKRAVSHITHGLEQIYRDLGERNCVRPVAFEVPRKRRRQNTAPMGDYSREKPPLYPRGSGASGSSAPSFPGEKFSRTVSEKFWLRHGKWVSDLAEMSPTVKKGHTSPGEERFSAGASLISSRDARARLRRLSLRENFFRSGAKVRAASSWSVPLRGEKSDPGGRLPPRERLACCCAPSSRSGLRARPMRSRK